MSRGPRSDGEWRPAASIAVLRRRAELLADVRRFFARRGVLEVETPLLSAATIPDVHIHSLRCRLEAPGAPDRVYLQTSPEFAMKRLLAAGSGAIYQICKAFRGGEAGSRHSPEFTMLEWYRPGFDHHRLMDEMDELLGMVLGASPAERLTYAEAFERHLGVDPHRASISDLKRSAAARGVELAGAEPEDRDGWLDLLASHGVEPELGRGRPSFVHDFPASRAALARIRPPVEPGGVPPGGMPLAERFEVYVEGVELANGFHELADAAEQRRRFVDANERRRRAGLDPVPIDERLLAALEAGLPDCAGVALGLDRLLMLGTDVSDLRDVLSFPIDRA